MQYEAVEQPRKEYKQISVGTHTGICYLIADIGTQLTSFNNPDGTPQKQHQVMLGFETPDELTDDGRRLTVFKTYTLPSDWTNDKASLPKDYRAWMKEVDPKVYDLAKLLSAGCNLAIGRTSGEKQKITGISALKATEIVPNLENDPVIFDMRVPSDDALSRLPQFIKDKILASPEYQKAILTPKPSNELNDSINF